MQTVKNPQFSWQLFLYFLDWGNGEGPATCLESDKQSVAEKWLGAQSFLLFSSSSSEGRFVSALCYGQCSQESPWLPAVWPMVAFAPVSFVSGFSLGLPAGRCKGHQRACWSHLLRLYLSSGCRQYFLEWASSQSQRQPCIGRDWPFDLGWQALDILLLSLSNLLCLLGRPCSPWWEDQLWGSDVLLIYSEMICSLDGVRWSKVQKSNYKLPFVKEGYFPK